MEVVKIALALETQQFIPVHDVLFVEYIRIAQLLCAMVDVNKVSWALRDLSYVTEELLNRTVNSYSNLHDLVKFSFHRMQAQIDLNASLEIGWVDHDIF